MREESREEKIARIHREQKGRNWHQPTPLFRAWWEPDSHNPLTGAQTGGHQAAYRKCVHRETREVQFFGIKIVVAFNTRGLREEFQQWIKDGKQEREVQADGTTATQADTLECLREVRSILRNSTLAEQLPTEPRSVFQEVAIEMKGEQI